MLYWICLAALAVPTLLALGWLIFRTWEEFLGAIWYNLIPDLLSLLFGRLMRDWMAELKLGLFVVTSLIAVAYKKQLIDYLFRRFS